ncbi:Rrf2 family transcriptional regulator [Aggregicoccus sp. 17bor-14]|uniref:RrF2 family transcriptional regulator n=1 Tax=Myxococcaceae TaxID=31 RepID=UPI00129C2C61|nr:MULTISPECIES: Rrf2 family transcriptional regulator [Myxococcaceae]MBF5041352.1 Rrf2 family transcriptional regulator [Simulacricoccus sp. 17bor-14]MRI87138.1 Rrf2 family transcriptional regulator [Aggregicoccus sp. 17bor-14]
MQHPLQISRKIEYGLRAMIFLASQPPERTVPFKEIARRMEVPQDFLAKILKTLVEQGLARSTRGAHGGYQLSRPAREISFLDVIEAVEGPVVVNVCQDRHDACKVSRSCTMYGVWKLGQERMLEVYRAATLDTLAMTDLRPSDAPVPLSIVSA